MAETATEGQFNIFPPIVKKLMYYVNQETKQKAHAIRTSKFDSNSIQIDSTLSTGLWNQYKKEKLKPEQYEAIYNENYLMLIKDDYGRIESPINIPVLIITAEKSFYAFDRPGFPTYECNKIWLEMQSKLKTISSKSEQIILKKCNHDLKGTAENETIKVIENFMGKLN